MALCDPQFAEGGCPSSLRGSYWFRTSAWDASTQTGIVVRANMVGYPFFANEGTVCRGPDGIAGTGDDRIPAGLGLPSFYGMQGAAYDWYEWTSSGLVYLGYQIFRGDCSVVEGTPFVYSGTGINMPRTFDDAQAAWTNAYTVFTVQTHYDASGVRQSSNSDWPGRRVSIQLTRSNENDIPSLEYRAGNWSDEGDSFIAMSYSASQGPRYYSQSHVVNGGPRIDRMISYIGWTSHDPQCLGC
jgi:hypothetical protein